MGQLKEARIPDIGDFDKVAIIEVLVKPGDRVEVEQSLVTLESDKASMEVPAPASGVVKEVMVKVGDEVGEDAVILTLEASEDAPVENADAEGKTDEKPTKDGKEPEEEAPKTEEEPAKAREEPPTPRPTATLAVDEKGFELAYASPSIRRLARELGVDLSRVEGTGRKGRILKEDVQGFVKTALASPGTGVGGFAWPQMPEIDFAKFGPVETKPLSRIGKLSAQNLHRSWLHVPHVTQHDEADITDMEAFRKAQGEEAKKAGFKLTPVAFLLKAAASALAAFPEFNASLASDGESLILKGYYHIGVAVDTPNGLVVPVIRDVDQKGLFALAEELGEVSGRAREGKLKPQDFQGGCFTISSLGGIGGTAFTPIVNAPEVAILGVSRSKMQPVYQDGQFVPRLMLPLSLSYDHRVIDGASAARFIVHLSGLLSDLRRLLL